MSRLVVFCWAFLALTPLTAAATDQKPVTSAKPAQAGEATGRRAHLPIKTWREVDRARPAVTPPNTGTGPGATSASGSKSSAPAKPK